MTDGMCGQYILIRTDDGWWVRQTHPSPSSVHGLDLCLDLKKKCLSVNKHTDQSETPLTKVVAAILLSKLCEGNELEHVTPLT